jgi:multidrug transporter EmrE-like cation transporter
MGRDSRLDAAELAFLFLPVCFLVACQLLVKRGTLRAGASRQQLLLLPRFLLRAVTNIHVLVGLRCASVAAACWTLVVSRSNLSVAYPFMGLGIVFVLTLSGVIFGETAPLNCWLSVLIVCRGLVVAFRS